MNAKTYAIEIENLHYAIENKVLFKNFTLRVPVGSKWLITGNSGSGKTTLLRMLLGFTHPDSGRIVINGLEVAPQNIWKIRPRITWVMQDADIGTGKVKDIIEEVLSYKANRHIKATEKMWQALFEAFDLPRTMCNAQVETLSGGERARLAIVIALLLSRDIYLLDEATAALDERLKRKVAEYFLNMPETVIAVAHDPVWKEYPFNHIELTNGIRT